MQITQFMSEDMVFLDCPGTTREEVLSFIVKNMMDTNANIKDGDCFLKEVLEREKLGGTGIGDEFAIPHARTELVKNILIAFARTKYPIDFESIDGQKVHFIFLLAVPVKELKTYLTTLAMISRLIKNESIRSVLLHSKSRKDILNAIRKFNQ